jgi:organic radical activating enzyme
MKHLRLPSVEFYITNVCNLACNGCNRFNNYKFKGFQRWADYKDIYTKWADEIQLDRLGMLGGEPLLNPDFFEWVTGLHELWPTTPMTIVTNAYRLNKVDGLYEYMLNNRQVRLKVGIHNKKSKEFIFNILHKFLKGPLLYNHDNSNIYAEKVTITDSNNISILVEYNWWFHQGSLIEKADGAGFTLYQSNPEKAHKNCSMKYSYTFINGLLYKCGVAALLPEFDEQYNLELTPEDRALMLGYTGLKITDTPEFKQEFVSNLPNLIDQCKFCPEEYHGEQIFAEEKKVVFKR